MRLTNFSDYARPMYAAAQPDRLITIEETAERYGISRAHLMKVVNLLTRAGYLAAVRGRSGGLRPVGRPRRSCCAVVRVTEPDFQLVECFARTGAALITPACRLRGVLGEALAAFVAPLDADTLADLVLTPAQFGLEPA